MRAKQILNVLPFGAKVRLVYDRFTVTPVATVFIFVALAHCIAQISLQAVAYSANTAAGHTISQILHESNVSSTYAVVEDDTLKICDNPMNKSSCQIVSSTAVTSKVDLVVSRRDLNLSDISVQCAEALTWPQIILSNAQREDVCFLVFQVWLLGISIVAILNESIPHLLTALVTHAMSSIWSAFQVSRTFRYGVLYRSLVVRVACGGINVLSGFWARRLNYFVPTLVLNTVAFVITLFVSYKLFKVYARQTFKRVGYSNKMNILYSYVLTFSVALQMSAFFIMCSSALWLDALSNGFLAKFAVNSTASSIIFIHICVWTLPWICIGWTSFRKEQRFWSSTFFIIGLAILAAWISAFPTALYREKFQCFPFFAAITVTSFVMLTVTLLLASMCRLNFGKGLHQYLKSQDLIDESSFVPVFLTRKRQSTLHSVVFPDKHVKLAGASSREKQSLDLVQNDGPPEYSAEAPGIKVPGQSFIPDTDRRTSNQQHGRHSYLHYLKRSGTDRSSSLPVVGKELVAIPEEVHSIESRANIPPPSLQARSSRSEGSSRATELVSLLDAWVTWRDSVDGNVQSRASTPPSLIDVELRSSLTSLPSYYDTSRMNGTNVPVAGSILSNWPRSVGSLETPDLPSTPLNPRTQSSASLFIHPPGVTAGRARRLGLPPRPNVLRKRTVD